MVNATRMADRRGFLRLAGAAAVAGGASPLLAGCGGSSGSGAQLKFMYWGSAYEQKAIADMLSSFNKAHKSANASPLYTPLPNYETKVSTLVAAGTPPDVAYLSNDQMYQLALNGKLLNLYPHLKKYPELLNRLPTSYFWTGPNELYGSQLAEGVQILWYNSKVFKDGGVDVPPADVTKAWTFDQFVAAAERLTLDSNGKRPTESGFDAGNIRQFGTTSVIGGGFMYALLISNGADYFDKTGTKYTLDSPAAIEVVQGMQDLIHKHHVAPTPAQLGNNAPTTTVQLQTRRIAMIVDGDWTLLDLGQSNLPYGCGVLPRFNNGQQSVTVSGGAAGVIFKGTKHLDEALQLYSFYNDPQDVDLFKNGLWMPLQTKYYTDPTYIKKWASGKIYPGTFKTAAIDPTVNHSVVSWGQSIKNATKIDQVLTPAFNVIAEGKQSAKEVLTALKPKVEPLLQGRWPTQQAQ